MVRRRPSRIRTDLCRHLRPRRRPHTLSHTDIAAFETRTKSVEAPSEASSQVLSFDQHTLGPTMSANNTAIRAYFRDAQPFRLVTPNQQHPHTRESSTLDGLDVYTQEVPRTHSRYWSIFHRLDKSPMFNPHNAFMAFRKSRETIEDEGFFEGGGEHNLVRPLPSPLPYSHTLTSAPPTVFQILNDDHLHDQLCPNRIRRRKSLFLMVFARRPVSTPTRVFFIQLSQPLTPPSSPKTTQTSPSPSRSPTIRSPRPQRVQLS